MAPIHLDDFEAAREHLPMLLDAAARGVIATVRRDGARTAFVDADRLRRHLATITPSRAQVAAGSGAWSIFAPGVPVAAEGATFGEAVTEMVAPSGSTPRTGKIVFLMPQTTATTGVSSTDRPQ